MSGATYGISHSIELANQFAALAQVAIERGRKAEYLRCSRWIWTELERTPLEFGEARYYDNTPRLLFRFVQIGPVVAEFAVMESERTVFIRRFARRYPDRALDPA